MFYQEDGGTENPDDSQLLEEYKNAVSQYLSNKVKEVKKVEGNRFEVFDRENQVFKRGTKEELFYSLSDHVTLNMVKYQFKNLGYETTREIEKKVVEEFLNAKTQELEETQQPETATIPDDLPEKKEENTSIEPEQPQKPGIGTYIWARLGNIEAKNAIQRYNDAMKRYNDYVDSKQSDGINEPNKPTSGNLEHVILTNKEKAQNNKALEELAKKHPDKKGESPSPQDQQRENEER